MEFLYFVLVCAIYMMIGVAHYRVLDRLNPWFVGGPNPTASAHGAFWPLSMIWLCCYAMWWVIFKFTVRVVDAAFSISPYKDT